MSDLHHIRGETFHGRRGEVKNAFRYSIDYLLLDADADLKGPTLFSRNRGNFMSLHDRDHGGPPTDGIGVDWVRGVLADHDITLYGAIKLLAQPRIMGHVFNPVSFWLCYDAADVLRVVIAEVTNTFGDRHSYLCSHDDLRPISREEEIKAQKLMHVSPFQPVEGEYTFRFDIQSDQILIHIDYARGNGGLVATLKGPVQPLTNTSIILSAVRRPFGSRRVLTLIHWQAIKLWWKGATYRSQPAPPVEDVSR